MFLFLPLLPRRTAVFSFAIGRLFACGKGALAATAAAAAAAAVRCNFSLIISVFECRRRGLLVVLLVLCDTCFVAAVIARVVGMYLLHSSCRDHRAF